MGPDILKLILEAITGDTEPLPYPFESPYKFIRRFRAWERKSYTSAVSRLKTRGFIEVSKINGKKFIKCTEKGQLELLIKKAVNLNKTKWDGLWRFIFFDIPENCRDKRDKLRWLLKKNDFTKIQASVFVSPYALNREAISYLKETGLNNFIRLVKAIEIDDDSDLRKKYKL